MGVQIPIPRAEFTTLEVHPLVIITCWSLSSTTDSGTSRVGGDLSGMPTPLPAAAGGSTARAMVKPPSRSREWDGSGRTFDRPVVRALPQSRLSVCGRRSGAGDHHPQGRGVPGHGQVQRCRQGASGTRAAAHLVAASLAPGDTPFVERLRGPFPWLEFLKPAERELFAREVVDIARACAAVSHFDRLLVTVTAWHSTAEAFAYGYTPDAKLEWLDEPAR